MVTRRALIRRAGDRAEHFRQQGFHCSEAVLRGAAAALGLRPDEALLRACTGLRGGGGGYGDRCGALEAGAMLIGWIFGRRRSEEDNSCASALVHWLHERFVRELGSTSCRVLKPLSHEQWSKDFSCGPVYRRGAELAVQAILSAHELSLTCPRFDHRRRRAQRAPVRRAEVLAARRHIRALARRGEIQVGAAVRHAQARLGISEEDISYSLATAVRVHPAVGGRLVVEGRRRDRWYLTTVVQLRPSGGRPDRVEVVAIL
ncbi:MAG: C-GCAxxG-C-C family (seleno)protein [Armatimonadota bacterium]|nr:C-GCAxxG-C-C family (seleno)protein [Armatimonadota bacterium]MDR7464747.1 C-GCAxxG-C-C family (seleno)protein [Armatimonadota bacterium]MDR7469045.1 C-GCAxxG-C-C family (seleno)protein [Armatimonadota bacterium]MDR7475622.1 C-GCAxxG-C-C family (seleno)protein [Armatimonadota bacterium]MDR7538086.1 C-GCAxxG-C-C family (seleno)protein [Armatimonadota bacterium]